MVHQDAFHANVSQATGLRRWLVGGLILSLGMHACLLYAFYRHQMVGFVVPSEVVSSPRVVNLKRVVIADAEVPEQKAVLSEKREMKGDFTLPSDAPLVSEIKIAPQIPELPQNFLEKTKAEPASPDKLVKSDATARAEMDRELNSIGLSLKESPRQPRQPAIAVASAPRGAGGVGADNVKIPGLDSIDEKLSKFGGAMRAGERAGMPGGALFEYDSAELREEAVGQLRKLGALIDQNPRATFTIEGHTDSFGSPGYNQALSERRAEAVKLWLVTNFHIAPERIATRGFGNSKPLVPSEKSIEEQAPNRRVELVVRTNTTRK